MQCSRWLELVLKILYPLSTIGLGFDLNSQYMATVHPKQKEIGGCWLLQAGNVSLFQKCHDVLINVLGFFGGQGLDVFIKRCDSSQDLDWGSVVVAHSTCNAN